MPGRRRTTLWLEAERINRQQLARLGGIVRAARRRRQLTQERLGDRAGLGRMVVSRIERGLGGGLTLDAWQRLALALGTPLAVDLPRDRALEPADAGHLGIQELVLRLGRRAGYGRSVELATKPAEPWRSIDVALADDRRRRLIVVECWNVIGDVGAAVRASARKLAEAQAIASSRWGEAAGPAGLVWVVRATARNRALVARYPELFRTRFPGSSRIWSRALSEGIDAPLDAGLVWASVNGERILAWRSRADPGRAR